MLFLNTIQRFTIKQRLISLILINIISFLSLGIASLTFISWHESKSQKLAEIVDLTREAQVSFKKQVQEWKNILLRGEKDFAKYKDGFLKEGKKVEEQLNQLGDMLKDFPEFQINVSLLISEHNKIKEKYLNALILYDPIKPWDSMKRLDVNVKGIDRRFTDDFDSLAKEVKLLAAKENLRVVTINRFTTLIITVLGLFYCTFISYLTLVSISKPLEESLSTVEEISQGNLTRKARVYGKNELSSLLHSINTMADRISKLLIILKNNIAENNVSTNELADYAGNLQIISDSVNNSIKNELQSLSSLVLTTNATAGLVEKIITSTSHISLAIENITESQKIFSDSLANLTKINDQSHAEINQGTDTIKKLISLIANTNDAFKKIISVTYLIKNIAKQTNLLSLNASIEAARAGSAGAGFAIVAENISRLADESLSRVKEIDSSIQLTQSNIDQAVAETGMVEKLFSMLLLNADKSEQKANEFKINMKSQNQLIGEIFNEMKDFQSIASLLEQGLQNERTVINSVKQEIQTIAGKSVETNDNAINVMKKITTLVKNTEKVNISLSYFTLKEDEESP